MTIQEYWQLAQIIGKDVAAVLGTLGALAAALAHLPFMPPRWAETFARFASYASQKFSVNQREPNPPGDGSAQPVHITMPPPRPSNPPPTAALRVLQLAIVALAMIAVGCSLFGSGGSLAPVAGCAPSPSELLGEVGVILLQGGDYESALKKLAGEYTESTVDCAVAALVNQWANPHAESDQAHREAAARGKAHLAARAAQ